MPQPLRCSRVSCIVHIPNLVKPGTLSYVTYHGPSLRWTNLNIVYSFVVADRLGTTLFGINADKLAIQEVED